MPAKILVVDDEPNLLHSLAYILNRAGYDITTAQNVNNVIAALKLKTFDLIILDLKMPDMDGLSLLRSIRLWHPQIPVFILTAYGSFESAIEALRLEARDYLQKPVDPASLLDRIHQLLKDGQIEIAHDQPYAEEGDSTFFLRDAFNVNIKARYVEMAGQPIHLPPVTLSFLITLLYHSPNPVSYQDLVLLAQNRTVSDPMARALARWHICQIRKKIEEIGGNPDCILAVRNYGYRLISHIPISDEQPGSGG